MARQLKQGYPHTLRVGVGTPEQAMLSLYEALGHKHPRQSDESEAQWRDRLKAIAVNLINSEGAILIRTGDNGGTND